MYVTAAECFGLLAPCSAFTLSAVPRRIAPPRTSGSRPIFDLRSTPLVFPSGRVSPSCCCTRRTDFFVVPTGDITMSKQKNGAVAAITGQVAKLKRAEKRALERSKKKARVPYCIRTVIPYADSDSMTAKFMSASLGKKGAATSSCPRMRTTFTALEEFAKLRRWGKVDPCTLTFKQFRSFIEWRIKKVSPISVQNEAAHIRRALRCVGRGEFAEVTCSSKNLGVPRASRIGKGAAMDADVLAAALPHAREDTKAILLLEHSIGLRHREAVMCGKSLDQWKKALADGQPLVVRYGTKGGLARSVVLSPSKAKDAAVVVDAALKVLEGQEFLVDSVSLKAALATNHRRMKRLGIEGENAQHSLRRSFTTDQYDFYCEVQKMEQKEALATLARDLGHGDRRGRMVYNCYLKATLEQREAAQAAAAAAAAAAEQDGKAA